jgi:O-antigen ligase
MTSRFKPDSGAIAMFASIAFFLAALILGGGSRLELAGPILLRLIAVGALVWLLWDGWMRGFAIPKIAYVFWAGLLLLPLVQLIPLPWSLWTRFPGRETVVEMYQALGVNPMQPISLAPERTANAFFALLPILAAFFLALRLDNAGREKLIEWVIIAAVISAALGLLQTVSGSGSALYIYAITNGDASVGFFSNANHHSLFLCAGVVLLFYWLGAKIRLNRQLPQTELVIGSLALLCLLTSIVATLSRAGVLFSIIATLIGLTFIPINMLKISRVRFWTIAAAIFLFAVTVFSVMFFSRIFGSADDGGILQDGRIDNLWIFGRMITDFFPIGAGLGTFDPVYRIYETAGEIDLTYLNNAHNDGAQILLEAGLWGLLLLIIFFGWYGMQLLSALRNSSDNMTRLTQRRAMCAIIGLALAHSLVDYPLRTGAFAVLFGICAAMLIYQPSSSSRQKARSTKA